MGHFLSRFESISKSFNFQAAWVLIYCTNETMHFTHTMLRGYRYESWFTRWVQFTTISYKALNWVYHLVPVFAVTTALTKSCYSLWTPRFVGIRFVYHIISSDMLVGLISNVSTNWVSVRSQVASIQSVM